MQTFIVDKQFALLTKTSVLIFAVFTILFIALPFIPEPSDAANCNQPRSTVTTYVLSSVGTIFFSALAWYGYLIVRSFPYKSITVDNDGLWLAHLSKETGLIRWTDIANIRERKLLQRMDLVDSKGITLLRLEYQLKQFSELRTMVAKETASRITLPSLPVSFSKPAFYHVFYGLNIVAFSALCWYMAQSMGAGWMIAGAVLVIVIGYEYLETIFKVTISTENIVIQYPVSIHTYLYTDIESVQINEKTIQGARHPEVMLFIKNDKKSLRLMGLGIDAIRLHQVIQSIWQKSS